MELARLLAEAVWMKVREFSYAESQNSFRWYKAYGYHATLVQACLIAEVGSLIRASRAQAVMLHKLKGAKASIEEPHGSQG